MRTCPVASLTSYIIGYLNRTGKSTVLLDLLPHCGFGMIANFICGSDFAGGNVGDSEKNVTAMFTRANHLPHLPVLLMIDEVEALVPDRNQLKGGDHAANVVNTVIARFGGGGDVKNLIIVSATNYLARLDPAFKRRAPFKVFIGLPTPDARWRQLKSNKKASPALQLVVPEELMSVGKDLTTNFSGANIGMLRNSLEAELLSGLRHQPTLVHSHILKLDELREQCRLVCDRERIVIGSVSLPQLLTNVNQYYLDPDGFNQLMNLCTSSSTSTRPHCIGAIFVCWLLSSIDCCSSAI
jgi:hypothetical protein